MTHADWMSQLPEALRQQPMSNIAIPGTHDSATSDIDMDSGNGPDLQDNLKKLVKYTCCVGKKFIISWSVTQSVSITNQLENGIRYFDLRLCYDTKTADYYFTHGLLSTRLRDALPEFVSFLNAHHGEVLLLDFNHFYDMGSAQHYQASKLIMEFLAPLLYPEPYGRAAIPSVKECVDSKLRVLLFYHAGFSKMPFWSSYYIPSPWGQVTSVKKMLAFLDSQYRKPRSGRQFYVTQGVITPDTSYISKHPLSDLRDVVDDVNPPFINWLKGKKIGPQGINICIVDFFQDYEVVPAILALNR